MLILTDWQEFAELDLNRLNRARSATRFVIDGRNLYEPAEMAVAGLYLSQRGESDRSTRPGRRRLPIGCP